MGIPASKRIPGATYRLQFNRQFTFRDAARVVEYLHELGVTDCYASPLFKAGAESTHGYDICGFDQFNMNVGSREEFEHFSGKLRELGLGLLLDIVPNHMGNDLSNRWWRSVLEKGRASPYANWFDIDWQPLQSDLRDKVLLPILEDYYAKVLEAGKLRVVFEGGEFAVAYHDRRLPLSPESYALVLKELPSVPDPKLALMAAISSFNGTPGAAHSFDKLHVLLQRQHYRLAYWRIGREEINYRRFFDVTELVSLRMELPEVFEAAHQLVFELIQAGQVTGLRVDHPDGLWDPKQYFERLQAGVGTRRSSAAGDLRRGSALAYASASVGSRAAAAEDGRAPLYVVAEKILSQDEPLPRDWAVDGTTGYDFLNRVNGLFVNPAHREQFEQCYEDFLEHRSLGIAASARSSKRQVLESSLVSELNGLTHQLKHLAASTRYGQDFTFQQLRGGLAELIAALPVYRTYITKKTSEPSAAERAYIVQAIDGLRREGRGGDADLLGFLEQLLLLQLPEDLDEAGRQLCRTLIMRFQQLTGPVMAKGLEDTAFYRYNRLISLNEVGGDPGKFGSGLDEFHAYNASRAAFWPHSLLATATHDTKRGEDARARINVLSEMPDEWQKAVTRWRGLNADKKNLVDRRLAPQANDEYLLYQTLIGAWPAEWGRSDNDNRAGSSAEGVGGGLTFTGTPGGTSGAPAGGDACPTFRERFVGYMLKAIREAKTMTSWTDPNAAYEAATRRFVEGLLADSSTNPFLEDFLRFQRRVAFFGQFNSLSQVLLKLTSPGVPDFYQGTELWDLSLVDPDNRRPVDYEIRRRMLAELKERLFRPQANVPGLLARLLQESHTGQLKLYLSWRALQFRRNHAELFERGSYLPLFATGEKREHVCAFARVLGSQAVLALAPRLVLGLAQGSERPPLGTAIWRDTAISLPEAMPGARLRNVLTQETFPLPATPGERSLRLGELLALFPVALLESVS